MKITLIGAAGGIGQSLALLLKTNLSDRIDLNLYDVNPSTPGIALDLHHIPNKIRVTGFTGEGSLSLALDNSDIVIITAGIPRKPGMEREDLFNANASLTVKLFSTAAEVCPNACFCLITNPLNSLVPLAAKVLKKHGVYNPQKVFGVTTLDIIRSESILSHYLSRELAPRGLNVIGGHSGHTILPLISHIQNHGLNEFEIRSITQQIQDAGTAVVKAKVGYGSATLAMASAAMRFIDSLIRALRGESGIIECAYVESGTKFSKFFSMPLQLSEHGWSEVLTLPAFDSLQLEALNQLTITLKHEIELGENFPV